MVCASVRPLGKAAAWSRLQTLKSSSFSATYGDARVPGLLRAVRVKSDRDRSILIGDLDRGLKNLFQVLQMVACKTAQTFDSFDRVIERYIGRIEAMARYHRLLTARDYQTVYFDRLIAHMLLPHFRPGEAARALGMALLEMALLEMALLGMVWNDLATKAAEYVGLATPVALVTVRCFEYRKNGKVWLGVVCIERNGAARRRFQKPGFGITLGKASLEDQRHGRVSFDFRDRGLRVEASFPAPSASS
jgi:two-component sensor histidine kinase